MERPMDAGAGAGAGAGYRVPDAASRDETGIGGGGREAPGIKEAARIYFIFNIYIIYLQKQMNMAGTSKRKIIDIREKTFKSLTVMAAMKGTNLKRYIENLLDEVAELHEDEVIYGYLASHRPEGKTQVGKEEKQDFESWLGVKEK
jgi:hypothetical protein